MIGYERTDVDWIKDERRQKKDHVDTVLHMKFNM